MRPSADVDVVVAGYGFTDQEFTVYSKVYAGVGARLSFTRGRGLEAAVTTKAYDLILYEFWHAAESEMPIARWWQPWAEHVVDTVDVHFAREESALALGLINSNSVTSNKRRELMVYASADRVVTVTADDDRLIQLHCGSVRRSIIPNAVPIVERQEIPRSNSLLFVGGFAHPPNEDGIVWFVTCCWEAVKREVPDAKLYIVGADPPPKVRALGELPDVEVRGYVPDTREYLENAKVSIAPLRYGGGLKGKVCEAMGFGLPVVSTSIGAQGLNAVDQVHLSIANTPAEFTQAIVELLKSDAKSRAIGKNGQQLMGRLCGEEVVSAQVRALLQETCVGRRRPAIPVRWGIGSACYQAMRLVGRGLRACVGGPVVNPLSARTMQWSPPDVSG